MYLCVHFCSFLHDAWEFGREDWSHEIETACRFGNVKAFIYLSSITADALTELVKQLCKRWHKIYWLFC